MDKKRGYFILIGIVASLLIGIGFYKKNVPDKIFSKEKQNRSAAAAVIDKGKPEEYKVDADHTGKIEDEIPAGYVQGDNYLYRFKKNTIKGYAEPYYSQANTYSETYYLGEEDIPNLGHTLFTWGYGRATVFAGSAAIFLDSNQDILQKAGGGNAIIRSSAGYYGSPEGSAHQLAIPELHQYANGNYGLLSGAYVYPGLFSTQFDADFNQIGSTQRLPLVGKQLPQMTPYGGFKQDGNYYLQSHINGYRNTGAILAEVDSATLTVQELVNYETPNVLLFYPNNWSSEMSLRFASTTNTRTIRKRPDGLVGQLQFSNPIANNSYTLIGKWKNKVGDHASLEYWARGSQAHFGFHNAEVVEGITDENSYYYWTNGRNDATSKLMKIDLNNPGPINPATKEIQPEVLKELPKESSLQMTLEEDTNTYFFQGSITGQTEELKKLGITIPDNSSSLIIGQMDLDFNILSAQIITTDKGSFTRFKKFDFDKKNPRLIHVAGDTSSLAFIDDEYAAKYKGGVQWDNAKQLAFWGEMEAYKNYAPGLYVPKSITINKDKIMSDEAYEKALLEPVKVMDVQDEFEGYSREEIKARVNRNPLKLTNEIDWVALGLKDKNKRGVYQTRYFLTDHTNTQTATSSYISVLDDHSTDNNDAVIAADNISIDVSKTDLLKWDNDFSDPHNINSLSKVDAWIKETGVIDSKDINKVTIDQSELQTIQDVKSHYQAEINSVAKNNLLKPYPLTIHYEYDNGKTIKRKIWVFVTKDNTTIENGVVLYGDDFKLPLREAAGSTEDSLLKKPKFKQTHPGVVVYDYANQPQDKKELTPLSKGKADGTTKGLSIEAASLSKVTSATGKKTISNFKFSYTNPSDNKTTFVEVTVMIDDTPEFCFKLERTKEELSMVEPIIDAAVTGSYKSIEVKVPLHVTLDSSVTLPSDWQSFPVVTDAVSNTYQFNMKAKNDKQSLEEFLAAVKFIIGDPVDKPGEVTISLREEELLANTPPLTKSAKGNMLRSSQVITTNDFRLRAESKWDDIAEVNFVDLEWDTVDNLSSSGYQLMQSVDGGTSWSERSLKYGKAIKVLNPYPNIAASNTLKGWMDGLGLVDKDGNKLIQVTPVALTTFNNDPDSFLKDASGEYQYDVVMYGSYDSNNSIPFSQKASDSTHEFIETGRGVLFGHDTVGTPNFAGFEDLVGVTTSVSQSQWTGSNQVKVVNNGYLMKYPFELQNDVTLIIPYAHHISLQIKDIGETWLEFINPSGFWPNKVYDNGTLRGGWYLKTNNNVAMIQTGHSNGQSTVDERKIIANTLYNIAQVSLDNNGQDYTVKDDVSPEIKAVNRDFNNRITIDGKDYGKKYQYYVMADTKDKGKLKSDVVEEVVTSDIKGYIYMIDDVATTVPTVTKDAFGKVTNINAPVVNPEVSREATISGITSTKQWLHVIPVDRANNVGAVKHIQIKDIEYTEPPEFVKCSGNIPQKIYIAGKDDQGNALPLGDQVLETKLRIEKDLPFTPSTIPWYSYVNLTKVDGTVITPETITVGVTKQDLEAVYTRSLTKLHVRQVILAPVTPLVEPLRGEGTLQNTATLGGASQVDLPVVYPTRPEALAGFKTITYEVNTANPYYTITPIVPEYYTYAGHVLTTTNTAHSSVAKVAGPPNWTITSQPEVWVTLYLTPNDSGGKTPGLYGWSYGNDAPYSLVP